MTANDSKSTPKKAEDATQHPLALAAELDMLINDTCEYAGDLEGTPDELMDRLISIKFKAIHLRHTLRAQAEAEVAEITWDAAVDRLMQGGNLVLTARGDSELLAALLREASERLGDGEMHVHDEFEAGALWYQEQQAPTQGEP